MPGLGLALVLGKKLLGGIAKRVIASKAAPAFDLIRGLAGHGQVNPFQASVGKEKIKADRDVAVAQINASALGWKDEFALVLVSYPYIVNFIIGTVGVVAALFWPPEGTADRFALAFERFDQTIKALNDFPLWYEILFSSIVGSVFGLRGVNYYREKKNGKGK